MSPTASRLSPWQLRKVLGHIDGRLADDITVAELAGLLGLSGGYFSRAFRASLGMPPHAFILHRRLARAMAMMRASSRGLSAIAQDCGFCDQPHLTKCFRRAIGTSPAAWRRAQDVGWRDAPTFEGPAFDMSAAPARAVRSGDVQTGGGYGASV
ncbi:helix-turn-helix domain-containing protein [Roseomonas sp. WA12]